MLRVPACLKNQCDCEAAIYSRYVKALREAVKCHSPLLTQFVSGNCGDFVLDFVPETTVQSGFRYRISGDHIRLVITKRRTPDPCKDKRIRNATVL
jgi:hypothetical protein